MGTLNQDLTGIKAIEDKINANKVATFAYTETAYQDPLQYADGVMTYDVNNPQNIPVGSPEALRVNETILAKGWRSQASSISRMLMNHFLGRCSYNLNQVNDQLGNLLSTLISHLGNANGIATLDANGRIPYAQLPESAMEFKGTWNASTNTPQLVNGSGTNGDFYVCNVAGTTNFGAGDIPFLVNDRAIYDGSVWSKLSAGDIRSVDGFSPDPATGNVTLRPAFSAESAPADNLVSGSTLPTLFGRIAGWINNFVAHRNNTSNPHSVTKSQVGLGSVVNTGDSAITADGGTTKFTTGGARNLLTSLAPYFSTATAYYSGDLVTYQNRLWKCTATHSGAWNDAHFQSISLVEGLISKYVVITRKVNGHALSSDVTVSKSDVGLGNVVNTGDSAEPALNGTTKFTTGGAFRFFGNTSKYDTWLSRVFGWAFGKCFRKVTFDFTTEELSWIFGVKYIGGIYFAYGLPESTGVGIWTSTDRITWTRATLPEATYRISVNKIIRYYGLFIASSDEGALWSSDGVNWNIGTGQSAIDTGASDVYASGTIVVAVGFSNVEGNLAIVWSTDGKSWTQGTTSEATPARVFECVHYDNHIWVAGAQYSGAWWSKDGKSWSKGTGMPTGSYVNNLGYADNLWVAGCFGFRGGTSQGLWWSADGKSWSQSSTGLSLDVSELKYIRGKWVASCKNSGIYTSKNGVTWSAVNQFFGAIGHVRSVFYANGTWLAVASSGTGTSRVDKILAGDSLDTLRTIIEVTGEAMYDVSFEAGAWFVGADGCIYISDYKALVDGEYLT